MKYEHDSTYLIHYGILGQKWGVRRFQNEDGTLTAAGKERYYGLQKAEDVAKDFDSFVSNNHDKIKQIASLSSELQSVEKQRFAEFKKYYSNVKMTPKQKKECEKIIDSWYGAKLDESQRDQYDRSIYGLAYNILNPIQGDVPERIENINEKHYWLADKYYEAVSQFTQELTDRYSKAQVYTTRKGIFGIDFIDKQISGKDFIDSLIDEKQLLAKLGATRNHDGGNNPYRIVGPKLAKEADKIFDDAVERFAKELSFDWYNKRKSS